MSEADPQVRRRSQDYHGFIDAEAGTIDRRIFSDEEIYQKELEQIFARAWNFMCHESQIPKPGDFFLSFIGEESVIATRDRTGTLQVFLNTCRHRGNAVCRAESGHASAFMCTYHGWTYDLEGKLKGVPGFRDFYSGELDKSQWGLIKAGKVQSYKGFVFATMDPDAPDLHEYLGEVGRMGMDQIAARGQLVVVDGIQKNTISCNWKMSVDNNFDWYHANVSHASVMRHNSNKVDGPPPPGISEEVRDALRQPPVSEHHQRVIMGDYGHAIGGPRMTDDIKKSMSIIPRSMKMPFNDHEWRERDNAKEQLGEFGAETIGHPNIFPNLWVANNGTQLGVRMPKGVDKTEIWWFTLVETGEDSRAPLVIMAATHMFGPAGLLEQDDGENWEQSTRGTRGLVASSYPLNYTMNLGKGEVKRLGNDVTYIDSAYSEHGQIWTWLSWADWMNAADWDELKRNRVPLPQGTM